MMSKQREDVIHKCISDAIEDEVDAVEDEVGYISAAELTRTMIAITIEIADATRMTRPELISMFENMLLERSILVVHSDVMAEA